MAHERLVWAPGASIGAKHFYYYPFILGKEGCTLGLGAGNQRNCPLNPTLKISGPWVRAFDVSEPDVFSLNTRPYT